MVPVLDLLALSQVPGVGTNRLRNLVSRFGTPAEVLSASAREISQVDGFSRKLASGIVQYRKSPAFDTARAYAEKQLSRLNRTGGKIVTWWDEAYPELLRRIYDPPAFFFMKGSLTDSDRYAVAVVGTRSPTEYGLSVAGKFSQ